MLNFKKCPSIKITLHSSLGPGSGKEGKPAGAPEEPRTGQRRPEDPRGAQSRPRAAPEEPRAAQRNQPELKIYVLYFIFID
jgi:hypothetical protein